MENTPPEQLEEIPQKVEEPPGKLPKLSRIKRIKKSLKENFRMLTALTLSTAMASYALRDPIKLEIFETGFQIQVALSSMGPDEKKTKIATFKSTRARHRRRLPNIIAHEKEQKDYLKNVRQVVDGSINSIQNLNGDFSPRHIIHEYERLVFGVSDVETKNGELGTDELLTQLRKIAPEEPTVEFLEIARKIIAPSQAYDESRSLSLDSRGLDYFGIERRQNCVARAKDWIIALSELWPDRKDKIYIQRFMNHIRVLYEIDDEKYVLEGIIPMFPDKISKRLPTAIMPLSGYLADLVGTKMNKIEGVYYAGPIIKIGRLPVNYTEDAYSKHSFISNLRLGSYGRDRDDPIWRGDRMSMEDREELTIREMRRAEKTKGENAQSTRMLVQKHEDAIAQRDEARKMAQEESRKAAKARQNDHKTEKENEIKPPSTALPEMSEAFLDESENPKHDFSPDGIFDIDTEQLIKPIELTLLPMGPLNRETVEQILKKGRIDDLSGFESITLDGAQALKEKMKNPYYIYNLSSIQKWEPGSWSALNDDSSLNIIQMSAATFHNARFAKEVITHPPKSLIFSEITPELIRKLQLLPSSMEIVFKVETITPKEAELLTHLKSAVSLYRIKYIPDSAAEILLKGNENIIFGSNAIQSYLTAKLYTHSKVFKKNQMPIVAPRLTREIMKAFRESGQDLVFIGGSIIDPGAIRELVGDQHELQFAEFTTFTPKFAEELKEFQGGLILRGKVLPPQTAAILSQMEGALDVSISPYTPEESIKKLLERQRGLTFLLDEVPIKFLEMIKDYKGYGLSISGAFNLEALEYLINNIHFPLVVSGSFYQKATAEKPQYSANLYAIDNDLTKKDKEMAEEIKTRIKRNPNLIIVQRSWR